MAIWSTSIWMITSLPPINPPDGASGGSNTLDILIPMLMVVGVLLLGILMTMSIRGKIAKRNAQIPSPRERIEEIKSRGAQVGPAQAAESKIVETTRHLAAQIDNKAERLELLLAEADQRIANLTRAVEDASGSTGALPDSGSVSEPHDPLHASVYELADAGHDPIQIARQLNEQVGKVELILALRSGSS